MVSQNEIKLVLFCTFENELTVRNKSSVLITYLISFCETTERYPTFLLEDGQ